MSDDLDYWIECISLGMEECGLTLSQAQLKALAESAQAGHDNYGTAFYSPPSTDRIADIEREHKAELERIRQEADTYRQNAERAIKEALHQNLDANVSIGEYGEVFRHGGRTIQIQ